MAKYRKKPVEVEAMKFEDNTKGIESVLSWAANEDKVCAVEGRLIGDKNDYTMIKINNSDESFYAIPGDYIIKGVNGEFYLCKPDKFHKTYEKVE